MKGILQGLVCKSSQPTLGDTVASHSLINQHVHLEPLSLQKQGITHPLQSCLGSRETGSH